MRMTSLAVTLALVSLAGSFSAVAEEMTMVSWAERTAALPRRRFWNRSAPKRDSR